MARTYHFISGLPRSGSTLLCAVLRQNPRIHAAMTSPVASLAFALLPEMSPPSQFAVLYDDDRRRGVLRGVLDGYYDQPNRHDVVFDTNRIWCGNMALLADLYPNCRVICCVREIGWIIDSVERMLRKNPLHASRIFEGAQNRTQHGRVEHLMNAEIGLIGSAWSHLREAWYSDHASRLLVVSYDGFVRDPASAMRRLYQALGEPFFQHDFHAVGYEAPDYDAALGTPGLHTVASKITEPKRLPTIPPDLFNKYAASAFWRTPPDRPIAPTIIC